ncbi:hypothetical protein [Mycolicibacterium brisbanense]|uniref:Uncharacterized protein n=1 Tax=Mycolicibacterium brisbanense TaxID=146020 RepID=A0A117I489_9MYCO|nr:hypothetical protein [Mycolicibacterium brisbanense]MCV7156655.1 hypothetical protein [Mycolicibacterium brisbanense]GAS86553.1 putative uncharacterized protein [Mycolicibacterium brisbanense]
MSSEANVRKAQRDPNMAVHTNDDIHNQGDSWQQGADQVGLTAYSTISGG